MAYTSVPKDLNKVKSKIALNMTKRQLICFGVAAVIGIPIYIFSKGTIGNTAAVLIMMAAMLPFFFLAMYEKDGLPAEKILRNYVRTKYYWSGVRPYKTANFYEDISTREEVHLATTKKDKRTAKTVAEKHSARKTKSKSTAKGR